MCSGKRIMCLGKRKCAQVNEICARVNENIFFQTRLDSTRLDSTLPGKGPCLGLDSTRLDSTSQAQGESSLVLLGFPKHH